MIIIEAGGIEGEVTVWWCSVLVQLTRGAPVDHGGQACVLAHWECKCIGGTSTRAHTHCARAQ